MSQLQPKINTKDLNLSPSIVHHRLADDAKPALAWDNKDVNTWQQKLRHKLRELLGYDNMPKEKCELNPRTLWKTDHELGTIEKVAFTSEPGSDVTAYLCIPNKPLRTPMPIFICVQGHSTGAHHSIGRKREDESQPLKVEGDRDFGIGCMRRGIAALCIEQRAFGDREEYLQEKRSAKRCDTAASHALLLGRTLVGERVYDIDRGIDFLEQLGGFDLEKLGLMGNSGGGTATTYGGAILDRIKLAMPSCANCTFADSIMKIHHCIDNYIPGILKFAEMGDILGVIAPRPLVIVAGKEDEIFPIDGVKKAFDTTQSVYTAAGAENNAKLVIGDGGHRFYAEKAWDKMLEFVG